MLNNEHPNILKEELQYTKKRDGFCLSKEKVFYRGRQVVGVTVISKPLTGNKTISSK